MVFLISLPIFIGALDLTVVSAVLPHVILELEIPYQTGLDNAAWMITGYLLAYSVSMTFMGRLSDLYGRRRVYLIALVIFGFGSYLVAVADTWPTQLALRGYYLVASGRPDISFVNLYVLIASRMIQAFGAGTMVPVGMAMIGDIYPQGKRARPLGVIAAVDTAGWVVGHLYGGIVVKYWSWQMIFWLNLPVCLVAYLLIWYLMKGVTHERAEGTMDWFGALWITLSLTILNIGLSSGSEGSSSTSFGDQVELPSYVISAILLALFFLVLFIVRQRRAKHPLIDLGLFKRGNYLAASIANFMVGISLFIGIANVPIFINSLIASTAEQGAWDSGWMLSALTVPMAVASIPGGWLTEKRGYRLPSIVGLGIAVIGFWLMSSWVSETTYGTMIPQLALTGIGLGLTLAPIATAVVNASPSKHRGISSAIVIIFRLIGMTVGVSGITSYGLRRADQISKILLSDAAGVNNVISVGMEVIERVISETFIIAGVVAGLAIIPVMIMKNNEPLEVTND